VMVREGKFKEILELVQESGLPPFPLLTLVNC